MESLPRRSCLLFGWNSSGKVTSFPQMDDFFPVVWAVSPPWIINPRMFRWNIVPLYFPAAARARKLKAVRGQVSQKISHLRSPAVVWIVTDMMLWMLCVWVFLLSVLIWWNTPALFRVEDVRCDTALLDCDGQDVFQRTSFYDVFFLEKGIIRWFRSDRPDEDLDENLPCGSDDSFRESRKSCIFEKQWSFNLKK